MGELKYQKVSADVYSEVFKIIEYAVKKNSSIVCLVQSLNTARTCFDINSREPHALSIESHTTSDKQ